MSGKTMSEIMERFIEQAGTDDPKFYSDNHLQGIYQGRLNGHDTIFSYGVHSPLAEIMPSGEDKRGWWLLNGDRWSGGGGWGRSTTGWQAEVQRLVRGTKLPFIIVPFSALDQAGINHNSIKIVDTRPERYTWEPRTRDEAPSAREQSEHAGVSETRGWQRLSNGRWSYEVQVRHLGESLFTADYAYWHREPSYVDLTTMQRVWPEGHDARGTGYFLSAFDENEPEFGPYFLAQLPDGSQPQTVAEAREALKPTDVVNYEKYGDAGPVLRQGDVFAIPTRETTRELAGPSERGAFVLGVNHQVTEVRKDSQGDTYGRGVMRHRPREAGLVPRHKTVKLGDGKTWYRLATLRTREPWYLKW